MIGEVTPNLPKFCPQVVRRNAKVKDELESTKERPVDVVDDVRGQNDDSREALDVVQQDAHIDVGIAIGRSATSGSQSHTNAL